jgi:hypothetical protein
MRRSQGTEMNADYALIRPVALIISAVRYR